MKFKSRTKKPFSARVQDAVWPRMGWKRALKYRGLQLMRLSGSPHAVAAGTAAGIFAAFSPLFGLHYVIACAVAYVLGGSIIAAAAVTTLANPLTLPLFWAASYEVGRLFVHGAHHFSAKDLIEQHSWAALEPFIAPLLIGSVILGAVLGAVTYFIVRSLMTVQHDRKLALRAIRARGAA
ncbi:DUF2062 domain-containing protein [Flaviflagellibacter deserti]|uniref:DUF2062 domain-containing protein n=1 Tax=Flaviflagellibacter deserti TaxID=2267266 RepID=A0ABV9Z2E2_9HYPH